VGLRTKRDDGKGDLVCPFRRHPAHAGVRSSSEALRPQSWVASHGLCLKLRVWAQGERARDATQLAKTRSLSRGTQLVGPYSSDSRGADTTRLGVRALARLRRAGNKDVFYIAPSYVVLLFNLQTIPISGHKPSPTNALGSFPGATVTTVVSTSVFRPSRTESHNVAILPHTRHAMMFRKARFEESGDDRRQPNVLSWQCGDGPSRRSFRSARQGRTHNYPDLP
jgi:hypothetical protein